MSIFLYQIKKLLETLYKYFFKLAFNIENISETRPSLEMFRMQRGSASQLHQYPYGQNEVHL